ncbi:hypothetical protein EC9_36190 [Rosistilla ulvae]|uniref:Uncharacterized protein n=1 Tax=Rosistilla ulvae TaxID=1930277 RepID=A0A517M3I2_9BACT|nr:hypothetical protein EC9_36190 [Rosistilla ulvae]
MDAKNEADSARQITFQIEVSTATRPGNIDAATLTAPTERHLRCVPAESWIDFQRKCCYRVER